MRDIQAAWGIHQPVMATLGTLADAGQARMVIDVTAVESASPGGTYTVRMRRADVTVYEAASGLTAVNVGTGIKQVTYTLEQQDLSRPGTLWITLRAVAANQTWQEWTYLGWVSNAAYDGGHGTPGPLWAEALLAMLYASNGASDGGDSSGDGGTGGHAIWTVGTASGLTELTNAIVGDVGITDAGAVYLCVALPPTTIQAWARLTDNPQGGTGGGHAIWTVSTTSGLTELTSAAVGDVGITDAGAVYICAALPPTTMQAWARLTDNPEGGTGGAPMVIPLTVLASDWTDGSAVITKGAITAESTGILRLTMGADTDQFNAYAAARIRVAEQGTASMSILAGGVVPLIDLGMELILFGGTSGSPAVIPITVSASDWSSGGALITNGSITAASIGILRLPMGADADQYNTYAAARIRVAEQGTASMSIFAGGTVPTIDLELELILFN